jgi:small subunit ribosomal protein S6
MRRYECVVILEPDTPDDDVKGFTEKYGEIIKAHTGEVIKIEDWGTKKLAYLVKKREKGRYLMFDFVGTPGLILELERQFKISEDVMKYLSVKLDDEVDLEAFRAATRAKEAAAAEAAAPVAVEPEAPAPVEEAVTEEAQQEAAEAEPTAATEEPAAEQQTPAEAVKESE